MEFSAGDLREEQSGVSLPSGVQTTILGPFKLGRYIRKSFTIYNLGTTTLSGVAIQSNPDPRGDEPTVLLAGGGVGTGPNAGLWETIGTIQSIPTGAVQSFDVQLHAIRRWWRVVGLNTQTQTVTVSGYLAACTQ